MRLFLEFPLVNDKLECELDLSVPLRDHIRNICRIRNGRWKNIYAWDGSEIVMEKTTGAYCDTGVSLKALGLHDGMSLVVI